MRSLAPIAIFAFNRPKALQALLDSLRLNPLFDESETFIFVDGPRNDQDKNAIAAVVSIARSVTPHVEVSTQNKGLANSIISGTTEVIERYGKVIVLEDDLRLMPGFLSYMNKALCIYETDNRIFSICGYGLKVKKPQDYDGDVYLGIRSSSWGWATWRDRWQSVDWAVADWTELSTTPKLQRAFNQGGSDMYGMLRDYMLHRNNSWAIRFCYAQFKQSRYSIHPFRSLVANEGFGGDATNCKQKYSRFQVELNQENEPTIEMPTTLTVNKKIIRENYKYHSLPIRIYSKIRCLLNV
jgi:hypothetical protein